MGTCGSVALYEHRCYYPAMTNNQDELIEGLRVAMLGDVDGGFIPGDSDIPAGEMFRLAANYLRQVSRDSFRGYAQSYEIDRFIRDNTDKDSAVLASRILSEYHVIPKKSIESTENVELIEELQEKSNMEGMLRVGDGGYLYQKAATALIESEAKNARLEAELAAKV